MNYCSDVASAEATLRSLPGSGHSIVACDVSDPEACAAMVASVAARHGGRLDVLVNNAAVYGETPPLAVGFAAWEASWRKHLSVNVLGPAALSWAAANVMRAQKEGGAIVNVSSRGAKRGEPDAVAYGRFLRLGTCHVVRSSCALPAPRMFPPARGCLRSSRACIMRAFVGALKNMCCFLAGASKAALNSMTQSLAAALGKANVRVAAVAPGFVETDMAAGVLAGPNGAGIKSQSPFGRVASPAEVARVVLFLADPESTWLSGSVVDCNGASYLH
jgi:NAD(P)-dependent dehydrogenase (short-subunit alcohol dehydrogenase family)